MVSPFVNGSADYSQSDADTSACNRIISGFSFDLPPLSEATILEYTVPVGVRLRALGASLGGTGQARFQLWKGATILDVDRTSYDRRKGAFQGGLEFFSGDVLRVVVRNDTIVAATNDYEAFMYFREDLV